MDNRPFSVIKRGLRLTVDYGVCLLLLGIFGITVLGMFKDNTPSAMPWVSFFLFLLLFFLIYQDMHQLAFKEKRPQYGINPSRFKGALYGLIAVAPIVLLQGIALAIQVPTDYLTVRLRAFQAISSPVYWLAKLLGNSIPAYFAALAVVVAVAFFGYWAGYREFSLLNWFYKRIGYVPKPRKRKVIKKKTRW